MKGRGCGVLLRIRTKGGEERRQVMMRTLGEGEHQGKRGPVGLVQLGLQCSFLLWHTCGRRSLVG